MILFQGTCLSCGTTLLMTYLGKCVGPKTGSPAKTAEEQSMAAREPFHKMPRFCPWCMKKDFLLHPVEDLTS